MARSPCPHLPWSASPLLPLPPVTPTHSLLTQWLRGSPACHSVWLLQCFSVLSFPGPSECALIWKQDPCRSNELRWGHPGAGWPPIQQDQGTKRRNLDRDAHTGRNDGDQKRGPSPGTGRGRSVAWLFPQCLWRDSAHTPTLDFSL